MYYWVVEKGGVAWMMPIVLLSVVSLAFAFERAWFWAMRRLGCRRRNRVLASLLAGGVGDQKSRAEICRSREITLSPHRVFVENIARSDLETAERRSRDRADEVVLESRRFLGLQNFVANVSCSLGLLGTVAGVAMAFERIAFADPKGLTGALATAMYTTIAGLLLFFLGLVAVTVFGHLSDRLEERLEQELHRVRELLASEPAPSAPNRP